MATRKKSAAAEAKSQHFALRDIKPLTENQRKTFEEYEEDYNLVLSGAAGTGKSFLALYLSLKEILKPNSYYGKVIIIRSAVPTRELGFVPGTLEEKSKIYQEPYVNIVNELIGRGDAWQFLFNKEIIQFQTTSFLRGLTFNDSIIIFDEFQSASFHEIDSVLTRVGQNCRFLLCGDYAQNDLNNKKERSGFEDIMKVLDNINSVKHIQFGLEDIVRSGFVKEYLTEKQKLKL